MNILATYDDLINELTICGKTIDDFKMDLSKYANDLDEWKEGIPPKPNVFWAIINQINHYIGLLPTRTYKFEFNSSLEKLKSIYKLTFPKEYENILVAFNDGDAKMTQEDVDRIVTFYDYAKSQKK